MINVVHFILTAIRWNACITCACLSRAVTSVRCAQPMMKSYGNGLKGVCNSISHSYFLPPPCEWVLRTFLFLCCMSVRCTYVWLTSQCVFAFETRTTCVRRRSVYNFYSWYISITKSVYNSIHLSVLYAALFLSNFISSDCRANRWLPYTSR